MEKIFTALLFLAYSSQIFALDAGDTKLFDIFANSRHLINQTSFENFLDEHKYTEDSWKIDGFDPRWVQGFNLGRAYIDTAQSHFGAVSLRITYPANGFRPQNSGAQAPLQFAGTHEAYISYWLRFDDNFDWGRIEEGGKLPGLGGGNNCSGGITCDGSNGFSARLMWRDQGRAVLYLYYMDKPDQYTHGQDFDLKDRNGNDVHFSKGVWHQIVQRVKINTDNNNNGEIQLWINEAEALNLTGVRFVNDGSLVDNLYFSSFHGGSDIRSAPRRTSYIWFDDIKIFTNGDYTGVWWDSSQPGQGIQLSQSGNTISGAWYLYDESGNSLWVTFVGTLSGTALNAELLQFSGPNLGASWDATQVQGIPVGNVAIDFTSTSKAAFSYTLNGVSGSLQLEPFAR